MCKIRKGPICLNPFNGSHKLSFIKSIPKKDGQNISGLPWKRRRTTTALSAIPTLATGYMHFVVYACHKIYVVIIVMIIVDHS